MKYTQTYKSLAKFGKELLEKKSLEEGLPLISTYAKSVIHADRCSIFIHDKGAKTFWTTLSDGVDKITIPDTKGLVALTLVERKPIISNDPYSHPNFLKEVDKQTGYLTKSVITAPVFSSKREIIGVLQLINKVDEFNQEDARFMIFFAHYISGFLELTNVYLQKGKTNK